MNFKFSYVPIGLLAFAAGMLWVNVFSLFHNGILAYIGGIPAGIGIVIITVRSANILPRVPSKRARNAGWGFLAAVVIVEPIVLGFANWPIIMDTDIPLINSYIVAGGASLVVSLALVLGALVDRSLVPAEKPVAQVATTGKQPKRKAAKVARKPITDKQLNDYWLRNPKATNVEVAQHFGVTPQAISKRKSSIYKVTQ